MRVLARSTRRSLEILASRCQVLCGLFVDVLPAELLDDISRAAADLPFDDLAPPERAVAAMLLVRILSRWAVRVGVAHHAAVADSFVELGALPLAGDVWRCGWVSLLNACRTAVASHPHQLEPAGLFNARATLLVRAIADRYREPDLALGDVARATNMSSWYAAHLLTQHTGRRFVAHVRDHRIAAAHRLLGQTLLSVKQIAAEAGYTGATPARVS